jgi:hypothetical protein
MARAYHKAGPIACEKLPQTTRTGMGFSFPPFGPGAMRAGRKMMAHFHKLFDSNLLRLKSRAKTRGGVPGVQTPPTIS